MNRLQRIARHAALRAQWLTAPENVRAPITLFIHIPSTGGTTTLTILETVYGAERVCRVNTPERNTPIVRDILRWQPFDYDAIASHIMLVSSPKVTLRDYRMMTLLRDPAERAISNYYRVRNNPRHPHHARFRDLDDPLEAIALLPDNLQTRYIAGVDVTHPVTEAHLIEAKRRLREDFSAVGITERFDESIRLIGHALGWKIMPDYERRNVGSHRPRTLSDEVYAAARERSAFDVALYDDAQTLMDERLNILR
jgi:hypothetical protein